MSTVNISDCLSVTGNSGHAVEVRFGQPLAILNHDESECETCQRGIDHDLDDMYFVGHYRLKGTAESFEIYARNDYLARHGTVNMVWISAYLFVKNDAVISNRYEKTTVKNGWVWVLENEESNNCSLSVYDPVVYEDSRFILKKYIDNDSNELNDDSLIESNTVFDATEGYSAGYDGEGDWYGINYKFSEDDGVRPEAFGELTGVCERRIMEYAKSSDNKYSYNGYLYGFSKEDAYLVTLKAPGESPDEPEDLQNQLDAADWIDQNFKYYVIEGKNQKEENDDYRGFGFTGVPIKPEYIRLSAEPISDKSYVVVVPKRTDSKSFIFDPELGKIKLSSVSYNCIFQTSSVAGAFSFKPDSVIFRNECINSSKRAAERVYNNRHPELSPTDSPYNFDKATFDFNINIGQQMSLPDDLSDEDIDSTTCIIGKFSKQATFDDLYKNLSKIELNTVRHDVECVGYIGISKPVLSAYADYPDSFFAIDKISDFFKYGVGGVLSNELDINNSGMMNGKNGGGYVFIPTKKGIMASFGRFNYGTRMDGIWTTFYPVFAYKKNALLLEVHAENFPDRNKYMQSAVRIAFVKGWARKILTEASGEDIVEAQNVVEGLFEDLANESDWDERAGIATRFINEYVNGDAGYSIDIEECFRYTNLQKILMKMELYDTVIVNILAPCWRDRTDYTGRCMIAMQKDLNGNGKVGLTMTYSNFWSKLKTNLTYICPSDFAAGAFQSPVFSPKSMILVDQGGSKYLKMFIGADCGTSRAVYFGDSSEGTDRYLLSYILDKAMSSGVTYSGLAHEIMTLSKTLKLKVAQAGMAGLARIIAASIRIPKFIIRPDGNCVMNNTNMTFMRGKFESLNKMIAAAVDFLGNFGQRYVLDDDQAPTLLFMLIYACTAPELFDFYLTAKAEKAFQDRLQFLTSYEEAGTPFGAAKEFVKAYIPTVAEQYFGDADEREMKKKQYFYNYLFPVFFNYDLGMLDFLSPISEKTPEEITSNDSNFIKQHLKIDIIETETEKGYPAFTQEYLTFLDDFAEYKQCLDEIVQGMENYIESIWNCNAYVREQLGNLGDIDDYDMWSILFTNLVTDFPHACVIKGDDDLRSRSALT